jgi:predicted nucleic acid-binding protein
MVAQRALADTSLFIGLEQGRFSAERMPASLAVSTVTIAELKVGVLAATDATSRAARLRTLSDATALSPLAVDENVADAWAELRIALRDAGQKMPVNDSWIAATAIAHGLPVATQDDDYDGTPGLEVIKL